MFRSKAVVVVTGAQDRQTLTMGIHGTGKYPYISADNKVVDFGEQLVGQEGDKVHREVLITNHSLVNATFEVQRVESDRDSQFAMVPTDGVIGPGEKLAIAVRYRPATNGMYSCDNFDVVTPGGNTVRLTCKGQAHGPRVRLFRKEAPQTRQAAATKTHRSSAKVNSINFGNVAAGATVTRVLFLSNADNCPAYFQVHGYCVCVCVWR